MELEKVSSDIDRLWTKLRAVTPARIGLARNGSWVETRLLLDFQLAHAEAQDAVKDRVDADRLIADLKSRGLDMVCLSSKAPDRKTYLARPDFGRELNESAKDALLKMPKGFDVVFVLCDGLSADAVMLHATTLLDETLPSLLRDGWSIGPVAIVEQGRVAIGDEIGQLLQASLVVVFIGERPGLTSPKSFGVYLTWTPRVGRSDAERNCLSNVRPEGMSYREAADRLNYLCREARSRQLTGVNLKDDSIRRSSVSQLGRGGHWRNWVGNQSFIARHKAEPGSEDELAALVQEASRQNLPIRVAGSGHSFTPVVATSGLLLSLENMQGLVSADLDRKRVVVRAGTRIGDIGRALKKVGLSLANQGDIDTQAIAGALSTGTHGTGLGLACLSSQAVGMRLVQPDGSILDVDADRHPETMAAAQVSIGTLGVISSITLQAVSAYNLKENLWREDFDSCMERHDDLAANNRHFSFFWCPVAESRHLYCLPDVSAVSAVKRENDVCEMKVMNLTDEPPYSNEKTFERVAYSSEIYPIEYVPNFHELEYAIPVESGKQALRQIRELMLTKHTNCIYPVEYRFVAGDLGMLSPYYQRASVTVSVSGGPGIDYWSYLLDVDAILRQYQARPHWGKLHFNRAEDMPTLYPRFHDFQAIRRRIDPSGRFLNDHLNNLFE